VQVTDNDFDDTQPSYDGSRIAWVGRPGGGGNPDHIFYTTGLPEPDAATLAVAALMTLAGVASRRPGGLSPAVRSAPAGFGPPVS
jgi:hypothetical protein